MRDARKKCEIRDGKMRVVKCSALSIPVSFACNTNDNFLFRRSLYPRYDLPLLHHRDFDYSALGLPVRRKRYVSLHKNR